MGVRGKDGKFTRSEDAQIDAEKRRNEAGKEYGFNMRAQGDYQEEMQHQLEKAGLYKDVKVNKYGFGEDFMNFLGLTTPRDFHTPLSDVVKEKLATDFTEDAREFFTPVDDMYGSPGGQDMVSSYGRVPVNHLMVLASQRLGVVYRGCHGTADDVFRNRFDFVSVDDHNKVIKRPEIFKWMRRSFFWDKMVECFDFEMRSGLGHLIAYYPNEKNIEKIGNKAPKSRPDSWEALSAYWMTPNNLQDDMKLDYDKQLWDFTGGVRSISNIHHSRVHVLETRRIEGGLRGSALAELCWVPLMCYLNTSYYILKGLAQMGTHYLVFNSAKEYPTPTETQAYINLANLMRANQTIVLGKNAEFKLQNAAGKIGSGLNEYLEFLKEDVSSAWIIPKNQLFGRSDGGGMDGAGALISKEDYLASNLSTKQLAATNDIMYILEEMCGFPDLEDITLRWNLDMHKTEQQRLTEQIMAEQLEQAKVQTKTAKMMLKLQKHQVDLQIEMAEVQKKMMKENPKQFMETSEKDEENLKEKPQKTKDFIYDINYYNTLKNELNRSKKLLKNLKK